LSVDPSPSDFRSATKVRLLIFVGLLLAFGVIYGRLILADPILARDDRTLLAPIESIHSLADYLEARRSFRILDLQPVRDASFFLDVYLTRVTGWRVHHFTNVLLWIAICLLAGSLFVQEFGRRRLTYAAVALLAVHPVTVGSVAWIAARKHLLAGAFILGATLVLMRSLSRERPAWRLVFAVPLLFLASVLSQPITVLWPLWMATVLAVRRVPLKHRAWGVVAICLPVMVAVQVANYRYYSGDYAHQTNVPKLMELSLGAPVLAHGRYLWNFVVPTALSTQYDPLNWRNYAGMVLLLLLAAAAIRWCCRESLVFWGGLYFFPLLLVTVRMTNIFVSDTYALTSAIGLFGLAAEGARTMMFRSTASTPVWLQRFIVAVVVTFVALSAAQASTWQSDAALWERAYETDAAPMSLARHAFYLVEQKRWDEALPRVTELLERAPDSAEAAFVYAKAVSGHPSLSPKEKIERLERVQSKDAWVLYYLAGLHAGGGHFERAWSLMQKALPSVTRFGKEVGTVVAESQFFCVQSRQPDCDQVPRFARGTQPEWNEQQYEQRLRSLGMKP
jgi:tetratricopeptide (TPR) repeat protein